MLSDLGFSYLWNNDDNITTVHVNTYDLSLATETMVR
jgi:hypothetical protein